MAKQKIKEIAPYKTLYRDPKTGLAWVEDGSSGNAHYCHPSIHYTGSVSGMKKRGGWHKYDEIVRCQGFKHNISMLVVHDDLDRIAQKYCQCGGKHGSRRTDLPLPVCVNGKMIVI